MTSDEYGRHVCITCLQGGNSISRDIVITNLFVILPIWCERRREHGVTRCDSCVTYSDDGTND